MEATKYTVLYGPIRGAEITGEIPATNITFTHLLSQSGSASITLPLDMNQVVKLTNQVDRPQLSPDSDLVVERTAIFIERDGVIVWSGILRTYRANFETNTVELGCVGWMEHWHKLYHFGDRTYSNTDQGAIVKDFMDRMLVHYGMTDTPYDTSRIDTATGILRDRSYPYYEHKMVGEIIEQLAAVRYGFDWKWTAERSGDDVTVYFEITFPPFGRITDWVFEVGKNCRLLNYSEDGENIVDTVAAVGAGEGYTTLVSYRFRHKNLYNNYPKNVKFVSYKDVTNSSTLDEYAERWLDRGEGPIRQAAIEVNTDQHPPIGAYEIGDHIRLRGDYGAVSIDGYYRITSMAVTVETSGKETVVLELTEQGAFDYV